MNLKNKTILLTGATGGIGSAIAMRLASEGCRLLLAGRDEERLESLRQSLTPARDTHQTVSADINSFSGRKNIIDCSRKIHVDVLINAAGILDFQMVEEQSVELIEKTLTTNLLSPLLLCHAIIPLLKLQPEAAIVNIGSTFGSIGHPGFSIYCASKFGLRGFTEALRRELADTTIAVLYLAPRATATPLNSNAVTSLNDALGNKADAPDQVANTLVTLLKHNTHQIFMGWPEKLFIRLNALFPRLVHKALVKKLPIIKKFARQNPGETT